jgi:hypothetical protein
MRLLLCSAVVFVASRASAHGFELSVNNFFDPTSLAVLSDQPVLDNEMVNPTPGPYNVFTDEFGSGASIGNGGASYYSTVEGFVALVPGSQGVPGIASATFDIISPLYYSDGTGTAAVPASAGTHLEIYDVAYGLEPGASKPPSEGGPSIDINGSESFYSGFPVSGSYFHELEKDLYIAPGSTQTYGEYGFAFDATITFNDGNVVTSPTMVDVFALTDPSLPNGDFGDDAPQALQDNATQLIYNAVTAPAAVPESPSVVLAGFGIAACAIAAWRGQFRQPLLMGLHDILDQAP